MSERLRNNLLKYGIGGAGSVGIAMWHYAGQITTGMSQADKYRILSDGFSIPGLLLLFAGLMIWLSNQGALNGVSYVLHYVVQSLLFLGRRGANVETYGEYVEKRREKATKGFAFLFVLAAACLLISGVFVAMYYKANV